MSTTVDRVATIGHSGAAIMMAGMGMNPSRMTPEERRDDIMLHILVRMHKKEKLALCEEYSKRKGQRLERRVLP